MVLGDGFLDRTIAKENSRIRLQHSNKQRDYCLWKSEMLKYLTNITIIEDKKVNAVRIQSSRHPFYTRLREWVYVSSRKTVTEHALKIITPLGIAIWYMDDGCFCKSGRWVDDYSVQLYTNSFSEAENNLIQYYFKKKWGVDWTVYSKNERGEKHYFLSLRNTKAQRKIDTFFSLIRPYIHKSMLYKLGTDESNLENEVSDIGRTVLKNTEVDRNINSTSECLLVT